MKTVVLFFAILAFYCAEAQDPVYTKIDKPGGLPSNTVYDLLQDSAGYIWIAHDKGLTRYDGFGFKNYQNVLQRGKSLSNLLQDKHGTIWCQNFTGQFFYVNNDSLLLCEAINATGRYSPAAILNGETLVIAGDDKLRLLNTATHQVEKISLPVFSTGHYTTSHAGSYYFYDKDHHKLFVMDKNRTVQEYQSPKEDGLFYAVPVGNTVFYVPKYPVYDFVYNSSFEKTSFTFPSNSFIQNIKTVNDTTVAAFTTRGMYLLNTTFTNSRLLFANKNVSTVLQDREQNWWVGTINEGILFIPNINNQRKFAQHSFSAIEKNPVTHSIYLGTSDNEIFEYKPKTNSLKSIHKHNLVHEVTTIHFDTLRHALAYASDLFYAESKSQTDAHTGGAIKDIVLLPDKNYVLGASSYLAMWAAPGTTPGVWQQVYGNKDDVRINTSAFRLNSIEVRVRSVAHHHDTIYAATTNGLQLYTLSGVTELMLNEKSINATDIEVINNTVYVATQDNGLLCVQNGKLIVCADSEKLPQYIYKIKGYNGNVWSLSEANISSFHPLTHEINSITPADGLPVDELKDFVVMDDTVYVATNHGLVSFATAHKPELSYKLSLHIDKLLVNGIARTLTNDLVLESNENNIEIHYAIVDYKRKNNIKASYRLNGSEWYMLPGNSRQLNLASLAPGAYTAELRASQQSPVHKIEFTVRAPFYLQPWFWMLCIGLCVVVLYLWYQRRLKTIEAENKLATEKIHLEQALQQSLLASIKAQMNPHFIYNSLSSIQSFVYSDDKANAVKYLDQFSELTRKVLDLSNTETILLSEEITLLETYIGLEKMRFDTLDYTVTCSKNLDTGYVRLPSMIVQPFVENAIKHGLLHRKGEKQLTISFEQERDNLVITIEDNGIGRKTSSELQRNKTRQHDSFSISANKKRIDLLNAKREHAIGLLIIDKTDESGRGTGTIVTINIPLNEI